MRRVGIIGAGVVGLAIARQLAEDYERAEITVLEAKEYPGTQMSGHGTGVLHAGIYYPQGSLKDKFCARGNREARQFALQEGVPLNQCGKYVVANDAQGKWELARIEDTAKRLGIPHSHVSKAQMAELEPRILCERAVFFPTTSMISAQTFVEKLEDRFKRTSGEKRQVEYNAEVCSIEGSGPFTIVREQNNKDLELTVDVVINAAGLGATDIAALAGFPEYSQQIAFVQGPYWRVPPISHRLVYPAVTTNHSLGMHYTPHGDHGLIGPGIKPLQGKSANDLPWDKFANVDSHEEREAACLAASYIKDLKVTDLTPTKAGVRPQQMLPKHQRDFIIHDEPTLPGFIQCLFIESPGLTCALPIADYVSEIASPYLGVRGLRTSNHQGI